MRTPFGEGTLGLYAEGTVADSWETEVCDILRPNNHVEMQQVMDAMRSYAKQPNRNLAESVEPILTRLKGRKHLILGNHDGSWTKRVDLSRYFESVQTLKEVNVDGWLLTLCHYPMLSYPESRRGYMIYGHIHNNAGNDYWPLIQRRPRMFNAGVDMNDFAPVTFDELVANNRRFNAAHVKAAMADPFTLYCAER